jgi:hypothetical protein
MPKHPFEPCVLLAEPAFLGVGVDSRHDSYRLIVQREGKRVRLGRPQRPRLDPTVEAALRNRTTSFLASTATRIF